MASNIQLSLFLVVAIALQLSTSQTQTQYSCRQQYDSFRTCARGKMSQDASAPTANNNTRNQMQTAMRTCCKNSGCGDPYPQWRERNARQQCFNQSNKEVRQALEKCVRSQAPNFELPGDDNDKDAYWNFLLLRTFAAMRSVGDNSCNKNRQNRKKWESVAPNQPPNDVCGNDDAKKCAVMECLRKNGTFNHTAGKSQWRRNSCRIKKNCTQATQQCQNEWNNNYKPRICDCVNNLKKDGSLAKMQDNYIQCLRSKNLYVQDEKNDDGRSIVARFLVGWCPSGNSSQSRYKESDPCQRKRKSNPNPNPNQPNNNPQPTNDDGTSVQASVQQNDIFSGMLGGTDLLSGNGLLGGGPNLVSGANSGPLGGFLNSFGAGGGTNPLSGLASSFGGGGGLPSLGGGLPSLGGGQGLGSLTSLFGGGNALTGGAPALGGMSELGLGTFGGGGGDLLSSLGGLNTLGSLANFGAKKK